MTNLRVSLIQTSLQWEDKAANLKHFTHLMKGLEGNTDLVVLPEMFTTGFSMRPELLAEMTEGKTLEWMREQAAGINACICGSLIIEEEGSYYNRFLFVRPNGAYESYDKRHLFTLGKENQHYQAGNQHLTVEVKGWRIMPLICYDLRFPVWSRNTQGYDVLLYVANWPEVRSHAWKALLTGRAIENQSYTIGVNRIGEDGNGVPHSGDSSVIDYSGETLLQARSIEGVYTIELNREAQQRFRSKLSFLADQDQFTIELKD